MKKSKYQQHFHDSIVCILVPYVFRFNIVTVLISPPFRGAALIKGRQLNYFNVDSQRYGA